MSLRDWIGTRGWRQRVNWAVRKFYGARPAIRIAAIAVITLLGLTRPFASRRPWEASPSDLEADSEASLLPAGRASRALGLSAHTLRPHKVYMRLEPGG
jgi:hypothetical protein